MQDGTVVPMCAELVPSFFLFASRSAILYSGSLIFFGLKVVHLGTSVTKIATVVKAYLV